MQQCTHLELLPELEVEDLLCRPLVVPCTHLVHVGGEPSVSHTEDLLGQTSNKCDRVVDPLVTRDGNGGGLVDGLPVMDLESKDKEPHTHTNSNVTYYTTVCDV